MVLVLDYASPVPAILTMRLMGLPYDNSQLYANLFHSVMAASGGDDYDKAIAEVPAMLDGLLKFVASRRAEPRNDLTSFLMQFDVDGKRLGDTQLLDILWNLIGGGVDTTTSLTAQHAASRHAPGSAAAAHRPPRVVSLCGSGVSAVLLGQQAAESDRQPGTVLAGQRFRRNDRLLISWISANHDEREFVQPDDVVLDRSPNRHVAFGLGAHRCIEAPLARVMFEVMVKAVLNRMPDYQIDLDGVRRYGGNPTMDGVGRLPATFTPRHSRRDSHWERRARSDRF